ncbi:MAG: hypothetical protein M1600_12375 [Firmicutes bacterium]|nr:hypothetical protein [Bacillota bacterium]
MATVPQNQFERCSADHLGGSPTGTHVAQHFLQRGTVVLLAASGQKNKTIAQEMVINCNTVKRRL